jgi:hypothetical protein
MILQFEIKLGNLRGTKVAEESPTDGTKVFVVEETKEYIDLAFDGDVPS